MIGEASFHGLYVPWLMLLCGVTFGVQWLVHRALGALGVYRWVCVSATLVAPSADSAWRRASA